MSRRAEAPPIPDVGAVIDRGVLARLIRSFTIATGLGVNVVTPRGDLVPLAGTGMHQFCRLIQGTPAGRARCAASLTKGGELAAQLGEPIFSAATPASSNGPRRWSSRNSSSVPSVAGQP